MQTAFLVETGLEAGICTAHSESWSCRCRWPCESILPPTPFSQPHPCPVALLPEVFFHFTKDFLSLSPESCSTQLSLPGRMSLPSLNPGLHPRAGQEQDRPAQAPAAGRRGDPAPTNWGAAQQEACCSSINTCSTSTTRVGFTMPEPVTLTEQTLTRGSTPAGTVGSPLSPAPPAAPHCTF